MAQLALQATSIRSKLFSQVLLPWKGPDVSDKPSRGAKPWLVGLMMVLWACQTPIQAGIDRADRLVFQEEAAAAELLYRKLLQTLQDIPVNKRLEQHKQAKRHILLQLARLHSGPLHNIPQALADYEALIKEAPTEASALGALQAMADLIRLHQQDIPQTMAILQRLLLQFPNSPQAPQAQLAIAHGYASLGQYEQARTELDVLQKRWPKSPLNQGAEQLRIDSYMQEGNKEGAATLLQRRMQGLAEGPEKAESMVLLGDCTQDLGHTQEALSLYYAALPHHPNPLLIQAKVRRLRDRIHRTSPLMAIVTNRKGQIQLQPVLPKPLEAMADRSKSSKLTPLPLPSPVRSP